MLPAITDDDLAAIYYAAAEMYDEYGLPKY